MMDKTLTAEAKLKRVRQLMSQHHPTSKLYQSMASQLQPLVVQAEAERQEIAKLKAAEANQRKAEAEEKKRQAEALPKDESGPDTLAPITQADSLATEASQPTSEALAPTPDGKGKQKTETPQQSKSYKLFQSLARVEGSLKTKKGKLVLVMKTDQARLKVVQIRGKHTAVRLLELLDDHRQGLFSLYPQVEGVLITNFFADAAQPEPHVPPVDRMYISGKLVSREEDAFFVDIGRHKRAYKSKKKTGIPLKIEGEKALDTWEIGQWIGLVLNRQGAKWRWQGELREVLEGHKGFRPDMG